MQSEQVAEKKVVKGGKKTTKVSAAPAENVPVEQVSTTPSPVEKVVKKTATKKAKKDEQPVVEQVPEASVSTPEPVVEPTQSTEQSTETTTVEATEQTEVDEPTDVQFDKFYETFVHATGLFSEAFNYLKQIPSLNKDERKKVVKARKDFAKIYDNFNSTLLDSTEKQLTNVEKGNNKTPKKRAIDKSKAAIHKPREVDVKLTEFMGLDNGTAVSRAEALQAINAYVNDLKKNSPEQIKVEGNNKAFKVVGKLQTLFADELNKADDTKMPDVIKYTDIMKYMSVFFPKVVAATA